MNYCLAPVLIWPVALLHASSHSKIQAERPSVETSLFLFLWLKWRTRELVETHSHLKAFTQNWHIVKASPCPSQKSMDWDVLQGSILPPAILIKNIQFPSFCNQTLFIATSEEEILSISFNLSKSSKPRSHDNLSIRWTSGDLSNEMHLPQIATTATTNTPNGKKFYLIRPYFAQSIVFLGTEIISPKESSIIFLDHIS